jgi:hypothetical protein
MKDHTHHKRGSFEKAGDLVIVIAFVVTKNKHLTGSLSQASDSLAH